MKLPTKTFASAAKNIIKRRNAGAVRMIHPQREWAIGFIIGVLLLAGLSTWSAYIYVTNRYIDQQSTDEQAAQMPTYRASTIEEALDYFKQRQQSFENVRTQVQEVSPEPSVDELDVATSTTAVVQPTTTPDRLATPVTSGQ